jgi:hypothetical protein
VLNAAYVSELSMSLSCVLCVKCYVCLCIIHVFVLCLVCSVLHVSLDYPCLCPVSCVLSATCVSGLSMALSWTKTWIIQRHMEHLMHKTQEKDMANPERHVAHNTQDTVSGLSMSLSCVLCVKCCMCLWIIHVFVLCLVCYVLHVSLD